MVNIKEKFIPKNTNARSGYSLVPKYISIHNTANSSKGADAASHASYMSNSGKNTYVSYHYVVDDTEAYQLLPDYEVAWHAGDGANGTGNRQSLAIEICENSDGDILKATNNAVELTVYLMKKYNIPLSNVVQHNKWTGKDCPRQLRKGNPYSWDTFLSKVQAAFDEPVVKPASKFNVGDEVKLITGATYTNGKSIPSWVVKSKLYVREIRDNGDIVFSTVKTGAITGIAAAKYFVTYSAVNTFEPYTVMINTASLNVRKGPGVLYGKVTTVKKGEVYTIVAEKNGWGQLKSGAGWIKLSYTVKK